MLSHKYQVVNAIHVLRLNCMKFKISIPKLHVIGIIYYKWGLTGYFHRNRNMVTIDLLSSGYITLPEVCPSGHAGCTSTHPRRVRVGTLIPMFSEDSVPRSARCNNFKDGSVEDLLQGKISVHI